MDAYATLYRSLFFPAYETWLRHRPTLARLDYLERTQWRSQDELVAIQAGALARLVRHAFEHVPFYRACFQAAGITPADVRSPDDLEKLPVLTRQEARTSREQRTSLVPPRPTILKTTGGTTGEPLLIGYDPDSEYWRIATKLRGYGWAGHRVGDRTLHYWGFPTHREPPLFTRAKVSIDRTLRRETYVDCSIRGARELAHVVDLLRRVKPSHLVCYTQAGADLARFVSENHLRDWATIRVICGAERLFQNDREVMERAFGPAFETYGCREVMLIASECEAREGLHESMENVVVELLVREQGRAPRRARPGEVGEVVVTDLHNFSMPFLRYANGDLALAGPEGRCACGRWLRRIQSVEGRVTEALRGANGERVGGMVFNLIFSALATRVRHFQAVQHRDGAITLKIVPLNGLDDEVRRHIARNCEKYLAGVRVQLEAVTEIALSGSGKRHPVIVEQ